MYIFSKTHFLKYVSPYFFTLIRPCFSLFAIFSFLSFFSTALFAQNNLQIQVLSEEGEALIGASASVKNAPTIGATADENGNLTLTDIPNGAQTITVSFLGYEPQERTLGFPRAAS